MSQLRRMKSVVEKSYDQSLRAEEAILMVKGRMALDIVKLPHIIANRHVRSHLKSNKKEMKKLL